MKMAKASKLASAWISLALASLAAGGSALGQENVRTFCSGGPLCIPDTLRVVFTSGPEPTSILEVPSLAVGERVDAEIQIDVVTPGIQGFSYGVKHDTAALDLVADSVTTAGTILDPLFPGTVLDTSHFVVARAVDGGFISAVVLSLTSAPLYVLPAGTHAVCRAGYARRETGEPLDTRVAFAHREVAVPGSPPVDITLVVPPDSLQPTTLADGIIRETGGGEVECGDGIDNDEDGRVDCNDPDCQRGGACPPCDEWAFYFGPEAAAEPLDARGEGSLAVSLRCATGALGFSLGVKVEETAEGFAYSFSSGLATHPGRPVYLTITDEQAESRQPAASHTALAGGPPVAITRGAAIAEFAPQDFFSVDLDPAEGGPGFTVGYIADAAGAGSAIPATADDRNLCPATEILRLHLDEVPERFQRGDVNGDGRLNVTDVPLLLRVVLGQIPAPFDCDDALDTNDDGHANITDALPPLWYLFQRGPRLPDPFRCGIDWTDDDLTCRESSPACPDEG
ncbi:MAG: dockerin type I repeat-containing protein [Planctomycetes bacterium]|nr:dockerin type I repeat-containing protein [Planctomycetota bacterium]